ncbi:MAG TPA: methyltransferase domain-containing protein [Verrucomicrobiae bacterium]|jgi:trans-aconitate 2-methyltransferase|nr:methyltransferase domain-containing protein [Verrucomicrobiae bacterium]
MTITREWDSAAYHKLSDPQYGWGVKVLRKLQALPLRGDEHILDAGCGTGRVTADLLQAFPKCRVTAMDASANMVEEAGKRLSPLGPRVQVAQLDLLDLSDANTFDVVFSTAVFHWIKDHDKLFQNLFRALRPGGILLAQCGGGRNVERLRERTKRVMAMPQYARYFENWERLWEYPDAELTTKRLQSAGFANVSAGLEEAPTQLPDEATFRSFVATVILHPHLKRLPPELHDDFLGELARQAAQDTPPFLLDYWRLNMYGRKP